MATPPARIVLSVTGSDRPGLTSALAEAVLAAGGNWQEGHFSRLGGLYVGSVLVEIAAENISGLEQSVSGIDTLGLHVVTTPAAEDGASAGQPLLIDLLGNDRPGIVSQVTKVLAGLGANIESLSSHEETGAWGGERLFRAQILAILPQGVLPEDAQQALEAISGELMVDFTFEGGA